MEEMHIATEIAITAALVIAGAFGLVGSYGMIKLRDSLQRLHAPTKATTLGVGGVLVASMLYFWLVAGSFSFHELLISLFLFLTAPISGSFIAKTYMQAHTKPEDLPATGRPVGWAIYDDRPMAGRGD